MWSTFWYFNPEGHVVQFTGNTFDHEDMNLAGWHGGYWSLGQVLRRWESLHPA